MKYLIIESLRRIIQIIFGLEIFEFPGLSHIRNFFYRLVFKIGSSPIIGKEVRLYRVHGIKNGDIIIGKNCLLANHVQIDYTGKVELKDNVWISDGSHIHSHTHQLSANRILRKPEQIVLIHLAAKRFEPNATMNEYLENISIASNVFEACVKTNISNIVNLSTIGVYNSEESVPWSENTVANPMTYYGISKLCIEKVAHYYNSKFNLCIKNLRLAQVLGPGERKGFMLSVFLSKALKKETLQLYGMGKGARDYIYVKDVISAINSAINHPQAQGLFNIGSNKSISHRKLAETINEVFDNKDNLELLLDKIEDTTEYRMSSDKSIDELNYCSKFTLKTALEDMKKYYEEIL